jgi:YkoY family integral membrane protein
VRYCDHVPVASSDLVTILLLVALEGLLSADNALVMAIMVLGLPRHQRHKALRYGLVGAFVMRVLATLAAVYLIRLAFVKLLGGLYLFYLVVAHFRGGEGQEDRRSPPKARPWLGMTAFWATVVRVELVNLAFSIDSILVAVAMSPKLLVVMIGGILGIIAMRVVVGQLLALIQEYPALVDGAFVIIAWVAFKLVTEFGHQMGYVHWKIPQWFSLTLIVVIFLVSYVLARRHPAPLDGNDARAAL